MTGRGEARMWTAAVEGAIRFFERWDGVDEVTATVLVGLVVGSVTFVNVAFFGLLVWTCARKQRASCWRAATCLPLRKDEEEGGRESEDAQGSEREEEAEEQSKCGDKHMIAGGAGIETRVQEGGYRSDSDSDDDGEGAKVTKEAQRRARKCGGV